MGRKGRKKRGKEPDLADQVEEAWRKDEVSGEEGPSTDFVQLVLVTAGGLDTCFRVVDVAELVAPQTIAITPLPNLPPVFIGLARRQGHLLPVADLGLILSGKRCPRVGRARVVVCRAPEGRVGLFVDELEGLVDIPAECIGSLARGQWGRAGAFVTEVVRHRGREHLVLSLAALWQSIRAQVPVREVLGWTTQAT